MFKQARILFEGLVFAVQALAVNKLRTLLSLMGVTIGIFSIVSVFTLVDALEGEIRGSIQELGENVVYVEKWPWIMGSDYPWWEFVNRPEVSLKELEQIAARSEFASATGFELDFSKTIKFKSNSIQGQDIKAITPQYDQVRSFKLADGRYMTQQEFRSGSPVCIIGDYVAYVLFGSINPVGQQVKIGGKSTTVVGVFAREGDGMFGTSLDETVVIPVNYAQSMINLKMRWVSPKIFAKAKEGVSIPQLKDEMMVIMRSLRRLKPKEDQNFALNEISILSRGFDDFFAFIGMVGLIIGGFSILVGGFGIANIMFVSVKERTGVIGIQKSLGARNSFILTQFLAEAIILCVIGGGVGLFFIFLIGMAITVFADFEVILSLKNIILGFGISATIGLISGFVPALSASRLNPVEAIRR